MHIDRLENDVDGVGVDVEFEIGEHRDEKLTKGRPIYFYSAPTSAFEPDRAPFMPLYPSIMPLPIDLIVLPWEYL